MEEEEMGVCIDEVAHLAMGNLETNGMIVIHLNYEIFEN